MSRKNTSESSYDSSSDDISLISSESYSEDESIQDIVTELIYKDIDEKYAKAKYGDFKVVMMKKNGYINVSHLCQLKNKDFFDWSRRSMAKNLIKNLESEPGNVGSENSLIKISGGQKTSIRGTYAHPLLVPHIASWICPEFAIKVSKIVNDCLVQEYKDTIKQKNLSIKKKKGKISQLSAKMDKIIEQNNELQTMVSGLHDQNEELYEKLDYSCNQRNVPPSDETLSHKFAIIKNPPKSKYQYHVVRAQGRSFDTTVKSYMYINPGSQITIKLDYSPNSINLWHRVSEDLKKKFKNKKANDFSLKDGYTEKQLIRDVKHIHSQRYNVD